MSIFALYLFVVAAVSDIGTERDGVIHLTAEEAASLLASDADVQVLDVRTRREFDATHIEGAAQVSYYAPNFRAQVTALPNDVAYLVHCRSGNRSGRAVRVLREVGIDTIYHLDGGLNAWQAAGLPVVQKEATP
ncbi:MAG: rhodanese-like domain-containing protein [Pseudomonadota bacterium]